MSKLMLICKLSRNEFYPKRQFLKRQGAYADFTLFDLAVRGAAGRIWE